MVAATVARAAARARAGVRVGGSYRAEVVGREGPAAEATRADGPDDIAIRED